MSIASWAQVAASVPIGLGSGVIGARLNERAATRRYEREREDQRLPAVTAMTEYLLATGLRSAPDRDAYSVEKYDETRVNEVRREFDRFRHDLPADVRRPIDRALSALLPDEEEDWSDRMLTAHQALRDYREAELARRDGRGGGSRWFAATRIWMTAALGRGKPRASE